MISSPSVSLLNRQFVLFALTGGFAAAVNFCSRIALNHWMAFTPAIVLAYLCGMLTAFVLNRILVFRQTSNALHHQILWFTLVNLAAVLQTLLVSLVLARWFFPYVRFTWHPESVAHACGVTIPVITSFFGHKYLSFRNH